MHRARQGALRAGGRSVSVGGTIGGVITGATHPQEAAALGAAALGTAGAARIARAYLGSNRLARGVIERGLNPGAGNRGVNKLPPARVWRRPIDGRRDWQCAPRPRLSSEGCREALSGPYGVFSTTGLRLPRSRKALP